MTQSQTNSTRDMLLEAEVAPTVQRSFQKRYLKATGQSVSPGTPKHYQNQPNKWGTELRVYFNDPALASTLSAQGLNVESNRAGYMSEAYSYRVSDNDFWWQLVEHDGLRLGPN